MNQYIIILFFTLSWLELGAQIYNDECLSAIFIPDITDYCSGPNAFTTDGATRSPEIKPDCWPQDTESNDIWFLFNPRATALNIRVIGETLEGVGTLVEPSIGVYIGTCRGLSLIACNSVQPGDPNLSVLTLDNLVIGQTYYLRVDARNNNVGSFELCLKQFNPQNTPESDCNSAVILCDKSPFFIEDLVGIGIDRNEVEGSCIREEFASSWYKWTARESGTLEFTLTPLNITDDIDFAVYRLPGGLNDCANKVLIRCMASGETQAASESQNGPCRGETGLRLGETDIVESPGCSFGDNNFLAAINMIEGESYALIINNFSQSGIGFSIDFAGTSIFTGPEPVFSINVQDEIECDKRVFFIDESIENGDPITNYFWNFGAGAQPLFAEGNDPIEVVYESFGTKTVALTIVTDRGCRVTELLKLDVASCCRDDSDLDLSITEIELSCFESGDGQIVVEGMNGFPQYLYSIDNGPFQPRSLFNGRDAGSYTVGVQDIKGCEIYDMAVLTQPIELQVEVSTAEDTVDLGFSTFFSSDYRPLDRMVTYEWSPPDGLECTDCPNPEVYGLGNIVYTLTITDEDGCQAMDQVPLFTKLNRNFYAPNVLSLSSVSGNDEFKIITNPGTEIIEQISVFDRWGGRLYHATDIVYDLNDGRGWRGEGNLNQTVNPGVYVWMARIRFVDGAVIPYKGTITVIK